MPAPSPPHPSGFCAALIPSVAGICVEPPCFLLLCSALWLSLVRAASCLPKLIPGVAGTASEERVEETSVLIGKILLLFHS